MSAPIGISTTVRGDVPRLPYARLAQRVLGGTYELSLVLCGDTLARKINADYRGKTYAANVLSFPLSDTEGEIFLNVRAAEREARRYGVPYRSRVALLFVHGLCHLKGLAHGPAMSRKETAVLRAFDLV